MPLLTAATARVSGAGRPAAIVTTIFAGIALVSFVASSISGLSGPTVIVVGCVTGVLLAAAVRSWWIGVWLTPSALVARTWWRRVSIPREAIASCVSAHYGGIFSKGSQVSGLRELEISTKDFRTYRLSGTVDFAQRSLRQSEQVALYASTDRASEGASRS